MSLFQKISKMQQKIEVFKTIPNFHKKQLNYTNKQITIKNSKNKNSLGVWPKAWQIS